MGAGSGPTTPDGCAVDFYRLLPPAEEIGLLIPLLPVNGAVLDLGAGAGRIASPLASVGFVVTAVDHCAEMLAEIAGVERVEGRIENLDLGDRQFDAVLLTSYLLNIPEKAARASMLGTCRRYAKQSGSIVLQVRSRSLLQDLTGWAREEHGIQERIVRQARVGTTVTITWEATAHGKLWTQTFTHEFLDEDRLRAELLAAKITFLHWLDDRQEWLLAAPIVD